uniref:Uncharacterized protein n=2 Tax=Oryza TaxID=4527 RepID=A0A0D3G3X2_9ORYZ
MHISSPSPQVTPNHTSNNNLLRLLLPRALPALNSPISIAHTSKSSQGSMRTSAAVAEAAPRRLRRRIAVDRGVVDQAVAYTLMAAALAVTYLVH